MSRLAIQGLVHWEAGSVERPVIRIHTGFAIKSRICQSAALQKMLSPSSGFRQEVLEGDMHCGSAGIKSGLLCFMVVEFVCTVIVVHL